MSKLMGAGIFSYGRMDEIRINVDPDDFAKVFFKKMSTRLSESYLFKRTIYDNRIDFKGSVMRWAWNGWNLFNPITEGKVEFETRNGQIFINHKIYFTEIFTIAFIFTLIPLSVNAGLVWQVFVFMLIWLSYIAVYLITVYRFNSFIAELLIETNKDARYEFDDNTEPELDEFGGEYGLA